MLWSMLLTQADVCTQAIYVPADDLTDPAPATTFAHLDATTVLSRGIAELGIYPAVDPLDSTSRILDPNIVGQEHYEVARGVQKILQASDFFLLDIPTLSLSCTLHWRCCGHVDDADWLQYCMIVDVDWNCVEGNIR